MLRIKEVAKSKGISITDLADRLGIKQVTLSRTINGNPTIETLRKIASVLDCDVRELIEPTKDQEQTTQTPLYIKNEGGGLINVGTLDIGKIQ
jgi:regulatory protein|nr:MAG TPA: Helix-turn-helix XRE-family like protein [Bacteriophage sp.]